ncbi:MAG: OsmC family protein [Crenarchaeota archaeon]|nr:OsmC family protein [Thermoproteota archaeon]
MSIRLLESEIIMSKLHARARIIQGYEIVLDNGRSHCSVVDQPTGTFPGLGPTPLELCVMSHAGCYATIAVLTAQKMRIPLKGCDVKVEAVKTDEAGTITEEAFDIVFRIDAHMDRVQRLHEVTLKNCPVGLLFEKAGVKISYNLKITKE